MNRRLISLDALRGFTIAAMILVNNPGSWSHIYPPLAHKPWHGITPTDLIFPFFIFIVGVSIALAYARRLDSGFPVRDLYRKIIWRSVKIFAVGIFLNLYPNFDPEALRVAGVLQRIAIVFLCCALLFLKTNWQKQALIGAALLVGYWIVMTFIPTPGYGKVILEPGENMAAWVDGFLLPGRMWNETWDPEGLLSTVPAIATGIGGLLAGKLLCNTKSNDKKIIWLFTAGFVAAVAGYVWSWHFPLNKPIWSSSYVLVSCGLASMSLAALIFFIDELGYKKIATPFVIFGANAISVYVLADVLGYFFWGVSIGGSSIRVHFMTLFTNLGISAELASMLYGLLYTSLLFVPCLLLYRRKIFIRL